MTREFESYDFDIVTRHYGECQILCQSPEWVSHYLKFFKGAVRVNVELQAANWARTEEHINTVQAEQKRAGWEVTPPALTIPIEDLARVEAMNVTLHTRLHKRMQGKHYVTFPFAKPPIG